MIKKLLILFGVAIFAASCSEKLEKKVVSVYPNGTPMLVEYTKKVNNKDVVIKETRFYPNGEKSSEGEWTVDSRKTGTWTQWYQNGEKWIEEQYDNGQKNGSLIEWRENGKKLYEGEFKNDKPSGTWKYYDEKGNKTNQENY